jgi:hypothetical protein
MEYIDGTVAVQGLLSSLNESKITLRMVNENYKSLFDDGELLNEDEVCKYFGIKKRTLIEYRNKRLIAYYKIEGTIRYKYADIEKFMEECYYEALELYK